MAKQIPCGSDVDRFVESVKQFADAGFTDVALVQVGAESQDDFIAWAATELLPALGHR